MSNVKITQLPLATTPLTGTEVFPLVQGTTTKQVSITGLFTSPVMTNPRLGTVGQADLINATGLPISTGVAGLGTGIATFLGTPTSANLRAAVTDETGTGSLVFANSPTLVTPNLGTPSAMVATNITGTALGLIAGSAVTNANLTGAVTSIGNATSLGSFTSAQLATALTDETGSGVAVFATSPVLVTPNLGTPSAAVLTNATGLPISTGVSGLGTGVATFLATPSSANLAAAVSDETGSGALVFATSPTLVTPALGTPSSATLTNATGLPISTGVSGLGTGVATALAVNVGSAGAPVVNGGALGTPSSGTATNLTGLPLTTGVTGILPVANGGTGLSTLTAGYIPFGSGTSAFGSSANLFWDSANARLGIGTSSPAVKLQVNGSGQILRVTDGTTGASIYSGSGLFGFNNQTGEDGMFGSTASHYLYFATAGTEKMRLDSSGNLGIGVTPSASWDTARKAFQISTTGSLVSSSLNTLLSDNWYVDGTGTSKYLTTGALSVYQQTSGAHKWFYATSGTAGTTATLTQAMTLDANGNLGLGTTSPGGGATSRQLTLQGTTSQITLTNGSININVGNNGTLGYLEAAGAPLAFYTASTERVRIDTSGNVGIGTSSPAYKLDVVGGLITANLRYATVGTGNTSLLRFSVNNNYDGQSLAAIGAYSENANTTATSLVMQTEAAGGAGLVTRATLDSAGNLGLGVTPSAWNSSASVIEQKNGVAWYSFGSASNNVLATNAYYNSGGSFIYKTSDYASRYQQISGTHLWYTAASGTAGNAISFTQAMTLDASGNLVVGATSTSQKFRVYDSGSNTVIRAENGTSAFEIQSNSNDGYINMNGTGNIIFRNGSGFTERARIDSSGNFLVGATATASYFDGKLNVFNSGVSASLKNDVQTLPSLITWNAATSGDNKFVLFVTETTATERGSITYNRAGGLVAYNVTSDYRAKDISGPVTNSGAVIDSTPVYMGKMKGATQERPMFIAHETPAYAHTGEKDAVDADGNPVYQQMDNSALIPVMWAEIQSLRQRVAQLETN